MQIGKLKHRIELQSYSLITDANGIAQKVWSTYAIAWGKISAIGNTPAVLAEMQNYEVSHNVQIRYNAQIRPTDRIKWNNEYYEIVDIINFDNLKTYQSLKVKRLYFDGVADDLENINQVGHTNERPENPITGYQFLDIDKWVLDTYKGSMVWSSKSLDVQRVNVEPQIIVYQNPEFVVEGNVFKLLQIGAGRRFNLIQDCVNAIENGTAQIAIPTADNDVTLVIALITINPETVTITNPYLTITATSADVVGLRSLVIEENF
ncbi:MAG: phage head closure protein [Sedimentisphaerales bacterium]|nr:phage head closure protein [Sedimentisphaerales bacterium]